MTTEMAKLPNGSAARSESEVDEVKELNYRQNEYVKLIQFKREYIHDLQTAYRRENEVDALDKNCDILDRLKVDLNEANKKLAKYQDSLEEVRNEIEEIENKPKPFIPNSRTFDVEMLNGVCCITAAEGLTVRDALLKSNRFKDIDLALSRLEHYYTNSANHEKETRYVNWADSSLDYVNCHLSFHTSDVKYLEKVASSTHNFDKNRYGKDCGICFRLRTQLRKCSTCKLKVCRLCEVNLTQICTRIPEPVPPPPPAPPKQGDDWRITRDQVTEWEEVGGGTWGIVYKAKWYGPVAVKKLRCKNPTPEQVKEFENEVKILRQTRHENTVLFMAYILDAPKDMCIVMHWCPGTLYKRLHVKREELSLQEAIRISKETAQGMEYLHSKCQIVHRDLKSSNIFLSSDKSDATNSVKIGDFGLATTKKNSARQMGQSNAPIGSLFWMAPEIMKTASNSRNPYTQASDMYAYGVVLFEIFAGELPYQNKMYLDPAMVIYMVGSGKMKPDLLRLNPKTEETKTISGAKSTPDEVKLLIKTCFEYEPSARPSFIVKKDQENSSNGTPAQSVLSILHLVEENLNKPDRTRLIRSNSDSRIHEHRTSESVMPLDDLQ